MRRFALAVVFGLVASLLLVGAARADKPHPLDLSSANGNGQWTLTIEKQNPWPLPDPSLRVTNPTTATWDINDHYSYGASGYLASGASVTMTRTHIFDWNPMFRCINGLCQDYAMPSNWFGLWVQGPDSLAVSLCLGTSCFNPTPAWNGATFDYRLCAQALYVDGDPAITDIAGSNGGRGVPTNITFTVTNPTDRTVRDVAVGWGLSSDAIVAPGCGPGQPIQSDYPYRWHS